MKRNGLAVILLVFSFLTVHSTCPKALNFCPKISSAFSNQVVYADTDLSDSDQEKVKEYYKLARQYYKEGNYRRTITECGQILKIDTYNVNAHKLIKKAGERLKKEEVKKTAEKQRAEEKAEKEAQKQAKLKKKKEARELARQRKAEAKAQIAKEKELAKEAERAEQARLEVQKQAEKDRELKEEAQIRLQREKEEVLEEQRRNEARIEKEAQKQAKLKKKEEARELARQRKAEAKAQIAKEKELAKEEERAEQARLEVQKQAEKDSELKEEALEEQRRREENIEEQARKQKQEKLDELLGAAKDMYSEGRYDAAIAQCGEILKIDVDNRSAQKLIAKSKKRIQIVKEKELAEKERLAERVRLEAQKQVEEENKLKEEAQIRLQRENEEVLEAQRKKEAQAQKQAKLKKKEEARELARQRKAEAKAQIVKEKELAKEEERAERVRLEAQKQAELKKIQEAEELARQKKMEDESAAKTSKLAKQKAEEDTKKESALIALQNKKIEERKQTEKEKLANKIEAHYMDGKKLYRNDEYSVAIDEFKAVLSLDSAHEGAKEYLKASEESLKEQTVRDSARQIMVAKKQIETKENLRKRDIQDRITGAKIKLDAGEYDEAIKMFEEILPDILDENLQRSVEILMSKVRTEKTVKEEKVARKRLQAISDERMLEITKAQLPPAEVRRVKELERKQEKIDAAMQLRDKASSLEVPLIKYKDTDLRDVVLFLIEQTGINIVVDEAIFSGGAPAPAAAPAAGEAEGWGGEAAAPAVAVQPAGPVNTKVTCFLRNMTLLSVLEAILRPKGLDYKFTKEYIWVSTKDRIIRQPLEDLETRVYTLEYGASMNIHRLTETGFGGEDDDDATLGLGDAEEGADGETATESGESIKRLLETLVPQPEGSSITVQSELNKIFVKNTPENLDKTEKILAELRTPVQVSIEARYVYVRLVEGEEIGIGFQNVGTQWRVGAQENNIMGTSQRLNWVEGDILGGITTLGTTGADLAYQAVLNRVQFQTYLKALQSRTDTNTLSAPKLTTLNNKPGIVRFVETINYVDEVSSSSTTTDGITTTNYDYTFTDRDVGMILNVTPQVNVATQCVTLFLQPVVSNVESWTAYALSTVGTTGTNINRPNFYSKDIETWVTVHDGDTIVLGGFMEDNAGKTVHKVPFLSDIPLLGKLFQYKSNNRDKRKLLIFVTVNILNASGNSRIAQ